MRAAWMFLLVGCGFQSRAASNAGDAGGGTPDAAAVDLSPICPSISLGTPKFHASACATPTSALIRITGSPSFDTDRGASTATDLSCSRVPDGTSEVCVLVASSIVIDPGAVVSAHGSLPFALFAHSITIKGTVDVASHLGGAVGAASLQSGCKPGKLASGAGGGRGGDAIDNGGPGGDDGSNSMTGATGGGTFVFDNFTEGGCGGTRGGGESASTGSDGGITTGGAGGGVVWIASLPGDLVLESGAKINASGASGIGGRSEGFGGAGGGAGGLIVLQAPNIRLDPAAAIFANGGHGGGGAGTNSSESGFTGGADGTDPSEPTSGGGGGTGGFDGSSSAGGSPGGGDGGPGFPSTARGGQVGTTDGHGGGGGGGGPGAIRVVSATDITGSNVSPSPVLLQ